VRHATSATLRHNIILLWCQKTYRRRFVVVVVVVVGKQSSNRLCISTISLSFFYPIMDALALAAEIHDDDTGVLGRKKSANQNNNNAASSKQTTVKKRKLSEQHPNSAVIKLPGSSRTFLTNPDNDLVISQSARYSGKSIVFVTKASRRQNNIDKNRSDIKKRLLSQLETDRQLDVPTFPDTLTIGRGNFYVHNNNTPIGNNDHVPYDLTIAKHSRLDQVDYREYSSWLCQYSVWKCFVENEMEMQLLNSDGGVSYKKGLPAAHVTGNQKTNSPTQLVQRLSFQLHLRPLDSTENICAWVEVKESRLPFDGNISKPFGLFASRDFELGEIVTVMLGVKSTNPQNFFDPYSYTLGGAAYTASLEGVTFDASFGVSRTFPHTSPLYLGAHFINDPKLGDQKDACLKTFRGPFQNRDVVKAWKTFEGFDYNCAFSYSKQTGSLLVVSTKRIQSGDEFYIPRPIFC
jgi:hypothetical protein